MKKLVLGLVGIGMISSSIYAKEFSIAGISFGMKKDVVSKISGIKCKTDCELDFKNLFIDKIEAEFDNNDQVYKITVDSDIHWNNYVEKNAQIKAFNKIMPIKNKKYKVIEKDMYNKYLGVEASFYRFEILDLKLSSKYIRFTTDKYLKMLNEKINK